MKLFRTVIENISRFKEDTIEIDLVAEKRVSSDELERGLVSHVVGSIYELNTISFLGINASGKTTALKLLTEMLNLFIDNKSLDYSRDFTYYIGEQVTCTNYIYHENYLYKIVSEIKKDEEIQELKFIDETIYRKKLNNSTSRKNLFNFEDYKPHLTRGEIKSTFLKGEDSIFSGVLNKETNAHMSKIRDMTGQTNINILSIFSNDIPSSFIQFFDSSIEKFKMSKDAKRKNVNFEIKFKQDKNTITTDLLSLENYLSSGTIRGINFLIEIMIALENGGYVIIDEIENHLNKSIIIKLISLFNSNLNNKGATLIFSTHYTELIDTNDRSDSIYLLRKDIKMRLDKYSVLIEEYDRKDRKKSDIILSGMFNTAPKYKLFMDLRNDLRVHLQDDSND